MRWVMVVAALVLPVLAYATTALAIEWSVSPIALELVTIPEAGRLAPGPEPELLLAQRVLDREWTTRADSLSNSNYVTGGKSELGALAMSAVVPGTGQLYVGERSGFIYLAAEVVAVAGAFIFSGKADESRDNAAVVAGAPVDSTSGWSVERWASATSGDPDPVVALYQADPEAYYDRIAKDPNYAAGWSSNAKQSEFVSLRGESDDQLQKAHVMEAAVWINHVVSAFDALRAARFYNLPLRRGMELKGNARWKKDGPAVKFAVVQRF